MMCRTSGVLVHCYRVRCVVSWELPTTHQGLVYSRRDTEAALLLMGVYTALRLKILEHNQS